MTMFREKLVLGAADYTIFATTLCISAFIGIYFQITSKKKTNDEYLLAGKDMAIIPVAFSLMATFMSATTLMGIPAEMYLYGTNMAFMNVGFVIGPIITAYVFLPIFVNNGVSSAYEYLEKRFGRIIRRIISVMFSMSMILFTSATLYAPALALNAVTNITTWMAIISVGVVCTFYCTLGGMKAVLWADVFQAAIMFIGLFAIIIRGCLEVGGVSNVFKIANDGGRLLVPKISWDLTAHYTLFNVLFQGLIVTTSTFGAGQLQIQRLLTLKTMKRSKIATMVSIPMIVSFQLLCCFCGLIFYAYFQSCDPLSIPNRPIYSPDQLMPYFITSTMSTFPGLPGLCVSGIFSASLSTVSSAVNSLAAVTYEDFVRPVLRDTSKAVLYTKVLSFLFGGLCIALSFVMSSLGNLVRMTIVIVGMFAGPNLAVFILGCCTTVTNEEGAVFGALVGVATAACLSFIPAHRIDDVLPLSNDCPNDNHLFINSSFASPLLETTTSPYFNATISTTPESLAKKETLNLAYMWISTLAMLVTLIVGYSTSLITRWLRGSYEEVPVIYLSPIRAWFLKKKEKKKASNIATIGGDVTSKPTPGLVIENAFAKDCVTPL